MHRPALLACVLALGGLAACQVEDLSPFGLEARLQLDDERVDYGALPVGGSEAREIALVNAGQVGLPLEVELERARSGVFTPAARELFVDVGARARLSIAFAPDLPEGFAARLLLRNRDSGEVHARAVLVGRGFLPDCDDRNPCTDDSFDLERRTCQHAHRDGPCDDGLRCTEHDRCHLGSCLGSPLQCDDGVDCTVDACDEDQGCHAVPDDARCQGGAVCQQGRCDAELGCQIEQAPDGTPCGQIDCAQMALCIQGQCRTSPTPNGIPCDDGNPCTVDDSCQEGVCAPGPEDGFAVSTPVDFDQLPSWAGYWPMDPVAVLAVDVPAVGGLDIVWLGDQGTSSDRLDVMRTIVDADGALVSTDSVARARHARAAFYQGDLFLLLAGCSTCYICSFEVMRISSAGSVLHSSCLDDYGYGPDEVALAVDASGVYVAQVADYDPWGQTQVCYYCEDYNIPAAIAAECALRD